VHAACCEQRGGCYGLLIGGCGICKLARARSHGRPTKEVASALGKTVRSECEGARVAVRHARRSALEQAKKLKEKDAKRDFEKQARAPHMHAPGVRVWNVQHGSRLSRGQLESRALAALDCKQLSSVTSTSLQLLPQYMLCT